MSVGLHHACGRRSDGGVLCWGYEEGERRLGPLGLVAGTRASAGDVTDLGFGPAGVVEIAAGGRHTCLGDLDGHVQCIGDNRYGQTLAPMFALHGLEAGLDFTCGLDEKSLPVCWGLGRHGQLEAPAVPLQGLALGRAAACGLDPKGVVVCWGKPEHPGNGSAPSDEGWEELSAGATYVGAERFCARRGPETRCWAFNTPAGDAPQGLVALALGGDHACGLDALSHPLCWVNDLVALRPLARPSYRWPD